MFTHRYSTSLDHAATLAPKLPEVGYPGEFFKWQEDVVELLSFIYSKDCQVVLEDLIEVVKRYQEYEDK